MADQSRHCCPNCRKRVPWVGEGPLWPCPGCGRMLRYDSKHHPFLYMLIILGGPLAMLLHVMAGIHAAIFVPVYLLGVFVYQVRKSRVKLADDHDSIYCAACSYDLRGTIGGDRPSCPECGTAIPPAWHDNSG